MIELPQGPFDVITADPPWVYANRVARSPRKRTRFGGGVSTQYPTMSGSDICALPVAEIAASPSLLFLWTTWPHLATALDVIRAWSFEYVTVGFLWVKTDPIAGGIFHGPGFYSKANTEPCLLARRGRAMKPAVDDVSSVVISPRREHSRKPEAVRTRIDRMYPSARKVELFCRESADGWQSWGNQVDQPEWARQGRLFAGEATT